MKRAGSHDTQVAAGTIRYHKVKSGDTSVSYTHLLQSSAEKEPEMYVALYADESVPYREIVRVLNIANEKMCIRDSHMIYEL